MKTRLGNGLSNEQYQVARNNDTWDDHRLRTLVTAGVIAWLKPESVLDPACGDGSIVLAANELFKIDSIHLYDISEPSIEILKRKVSSSIDVGVGDAFDIVSEIPSDVIVLTEFLEHIEDPEGLLAQARKSSDRLVASSPINEQGSGNHEHVWSWTKDGYKTMLLDTGWHPTSYTELSFTNTSYVFQIWACE